MKFTKMHGAGNDYIYLDARYMERNWERLAVDMSDRHTGIGADGIILLMPSLNTNLKMRMLNADGSIGEMCGNGLRCFVKYAFDERIIPEDTSLVSVETDAGIMQVTPIWKSNKMTRASVIMGEPKFHPDEVPVDAPGHEMLMDYPLLVNGRDIKITCVSMGNPHAVTFLDEPVKCINLHELGPIVEHHHIFPQRVNFEIANVIAPSRLEARIWERGSGITMASGTGASAVAVAARLHNYIGDKATVSFPGGDLEITWPGQGSVVMEGPVEKVFEGEWIE